MNAAFMFLFLGVTFSINVVHVLLHLDLKGGKFISLVYCMALAWNLGFALYYRYFIAFFLCVYSLVINIYLLKS